MRGNSRPVISNQTAPHEELESRVRRYRETVFKRPPARHSLTAVEELCKVADKAGRRIILDAGCGTGDSSRTLARHNPDYLVFGIDKSLSRLSRKRDSTDPDNLFLMRADLMDLYPLIADSGLDVARQYILYPNPWPKSDHLTRRWHASPVFPSLIAVSPVIELRTNWQLYAEEFRMALALYALESTVTENLTPDDISPFERKYRLSGQRLWRLASSSPD